jgi:hypothetical protein
MLRPAAALTAMLCGLLLSSCLAEACQHLTGSAAVIVYDAVMPEMPLLHVKHQH